MRKILSFGLALGCSLSLIACKTQTAEKSAPIEKAPVESGAPKIYVTNEVSGNLSIIDSGNSNLLATVPLGKRPRGIHSSPDEKTLYVALSGTPIAGPDVDESTLPPPDKSADGIGIFDVAQRKLIRTIPEDPIRRISTSVKMASSSISRTRISQP